FWMSMCGTITSGFTVGLGVIVVAISKAPLQLSDELVSDLIFSGMRRRKYSTTPRALSVGFCPLGTTSRKAPVNFFCAAWQFGTRSPPAAALTSAIVISTRLPAAVFPGTAKRAKIWLELAWMA